MKFSTLILLITFTLLIIALFASNLLLKNEYDKIDKSDIYWTFGNILQQPYKHLKITGGNVTNIAFEQSKKPSVRVLKNWQGYENKVVKAYVKNDTLFLYFPNTVKDAYDKFYMRRNTLVRIFSPELLSVDGFDTNFELLRLKQKSLRIDLSGKSTLEVESYLPNFDSLFIRQRDSSRVVFEMSPEVKDPVAVYQKTAITGSVSVKAERPGIDIQQTLPGQESGSGNWQTMYVKAVDASVQGMSILDLGHAQINSLKLAISDTSAIILSGSSLGRLMK